MFEKRNTRLNTIESEKALGKQLPCNIEAERAVLGSFLIDDQTIGAVSDYLLPSDFYLTTHRIIYETILEVSAKFNRLDLISLQDELLKKEKLETIGGAAYLLSLQEELPTTGLIETHARLIKEKAILRDLINSATSIITQCYNQNEAEIDTLLDAAEQTIFNIAHKRAQHNFVQLNIWLKKTFQQLNDIKTHRKGITGIPSGYVKMDALTSGFQNGDLIVLAARPSMGKTALALNIAVNAAQEGFVVGVFSMEMSAEQLTLRLLSTESGVELQHIRNASISSQEWVEITHTASKLSGMSLFIDDTPTLTVTQLRAKARKLKAESKLQLLVVDYLQLLHSARHHENRHQEVSEISRALKALAKELGIPIVALSQLSRAVDSRMDKRPMLSDLRESGAIEQDADLIMFLYRDVVYNPETENPALTELIIGKQRNGPTGTVFLTFARELTKFVDVDFD